MNIRIYTDGACSLFKDKESIGAYGIVAINEDTQEVLAKFAEREEGTTNNIMELKAVRKALHFAEGVVHLKEVKITIVTDSKYCKDGLESWVHKWEKNDWKTASGGDVKNKELWEDIVKCKDRASNTKLEWIKGHQDNDNWNNYIDHLVVQAKNLPKTSMKKSEYIPQIIPLPMFSGGSERVTNKIIFQISLFKDSLLYEVDYCFDEIKEDHFDETKDTLLETLLNSQNETQTKLNICKAEKRYINKEAIDEVGFSQNSLNNFSVIFIETRNGDTLELFFKNKIKALELLNSLQEWRYIS